jgi:hypothetical protein
MDYEKLTDINQMLAIVKPTTASLITFIANNDNTSLAAFEQELTLEKAIEGTSLRKLSNIITDKNLTILNVFLINRLANNFNVSRNFTHEQSYIMALDLIDVFKDETLEDLLLMFRMARSGRIGDGQDYKLDSQTVFHKWMPQYLNLKAELRENNHRKEKEQLKAFTKDLTIEDVKKAYIKKMSAQKIEDARNARIDEITKDFTREDLENLIVEWTKDDVKKKYLRYLTKKRLTIK